MEFLMCIPVRRFLVAAAIGCCYLLLSVLPAASEETAAEAADQSADNASCCGGTGGYSWRWERYEDQVLIDFGTWNVGNAGVKYVVVPSASGGVIKLIAIVFPRPDEVPFPELKRDVMYYKGVNPTLGMIIAEQHTPNEEWRFKIDDRMITDSAGFQDGTTTIEFSLASPSGESRDVTMIAKNGFWAYMECGGIPQLAFGPRSATVEELLPEWNGYKLVTVPIPAEVGTFLGYAHEVGEVWKVKVGGQEYEAIATEANPEPAAPSPQSETHTEQE